MEYGPAQEARDAALEKMRDEEAKREAPPPAPASGPSPQKLDDFSPPEQVTNLFTPVARAYVSGYDVVAHVSAFVRASLTRINSVVDQSLLERICIIWIIKAQKVIAVASKAIKLNNMYGETK